MTSDRQRLRRVRLIERLRSSEHRQAAAEAHRAELVRQKLEKLSERTRSLAQLYALRDGARDGADLRGATLLSAHMNELGRTAEQQASQARDAADERLAELAIADRKRRRAEDNRRDVHRAIIDRLAKPDSTPARRTGTELE
ncbi:hypothetical protein FHS61_001482 [Altererythrobacter atlanticus]|uniref:Uncharacterized protein n=1 Tax=Croceibacterium atlanticum TaxID=1267766 RepID=A0A0F7KY67_9SPHN|nr:hypothetical protein [Croceibacterium atlanticum]AKH44162.1 hypothetical protein WYH_03143 [Croceibacterium atlanticum]MBB5732473.1 hypothetical protein [Croceibacterium atlanticum]